jgi:SAM-dependent methyltransferase
MPFSVTIRHSAKWRDYLPRWVFDRIEVNTYLLKRYLASSAGQIAPGSLVLDAGAGQGRFSALFKHVKYVAVDLAIGDVTWDYSALDAVCTLVDLCFGDNLFDVAVCTQVLEHVKEPSLVLAEVARVLKPGGVILLSAPQSWYEHQVPHDFFRFTGYGLRHLLEKNGFVVDEIRPLGGYFWHLSFQIQSLTHWVFNQNTHVRSLGVLALPFKLASVLVCELTIPLALFYADSLDPVKEDTFGHYCIAHKALGDRGGAE